MSGWRGGGRGGGDRGGRGGFRGGGGRGGGRGGFGGARQDEGPPDTVIAAGKYVHACEGEMVIEGILEKVPYFNAPIYLENKTQIGKVEEIMGPIHKYMFSVKTSEGVKAESFKKDDKVRVPMLISTIFAYDDKLRGIPQA
jgi:H/ACA ribonucleoprotein complex subunit 1